MKLVLLLLHTIILSKGLYTPDNNIHMTLLKIPFQNIPRFALIITSILQGRLHTRFSSMAVGICPDSTYKSIRH